MNQQANDIARDLLPGFLHFISDKKWDDQLDELLFSDTLKYIAMEGEVPENQFDELSHAVLDRLRDLTKALCPQAFD